MTNITNGNREIVSMIKRFEMITLATAAMISISVPRRAAVTCAR